MVIVGHPDSHRLSNDMSLERMLLVSGTPVLIALNAWKGQTIGDI